MSQLSILKPTLAYEYPLLTLHVLGGKCWTDTLKCSIILVVTYHSYTAIVLKMVICTELTHAFLTVLYSNRSVVAVSDQLIALILEYDHWNLQCSHHLHRYW